jgi:hypothetical protein
MGSFIVGMFVVAAVGATALRTVMPPGLGKHGSSTTAEMVLVEQVLDSPVALTIFFFVIMLICALVMLCIWHLASWQEARDLVAQQEEEEERRKKNLLKHLRGTEAFEMPPPDKPVPRRAGTTTTASQDEERRSTCAICLEPLSTGDACRLLPCNHIFHTCCTDTWLEDRHSCPTCRQDIRHPEDIPAEAAEPQQDQPVRQLPMAVRMVLFFICISLLTGAQDRILDAIFGVQNKEPQQHHIWAHPGHRYQNVTAVHEYRIHSVYDDSAHFVGSLVTSPMDDKPAQDDNSEQRFYKGGFLRR